MSYNNSFANVYDIFTNSVDYKKRADYIIDLLKDNGIEKGEILDVACGTGSFSKYYLDNGFDVVANDISIEMLNIARDKLKPYGDRVLLLCQDMCSLDLFGTVNAAVCSLDSINHLLDENDIYDAFNSIYTFIEPNGIFIFDVNTLYKHKEILADNTFVYENDNTFLVWQNSEMCEDGTIEMYIDLFSLDDDGKYIRESEFITERAYSIEFLSELLKEVGFDIIGIYSDLSKNIISAQDERVYFVAKK